MAPQKKKGSMSGGGTPPEGFPDAESKPGVATDESMHAQMMAAIQQHSHQMSSLTMKVEDMEVRGKVDAGAEDDGRIT
ncbi:hypothetical protein CYMTET_52790 [Cymbomonas tetramitiformis]|uniref:Uncharacterized protein n=1 Tax=Cymbomonas tetramitiformis TaxID=36881 RepID=A0AAE0BK25_9CHLO|nr:hypothetical protein CYMTET_52790 [Cymbomonas tetramitiformis]